MPPKAQTTPQPSTNRSETSTSAQTSPLHPVYPGVVSSVMAADVQGPAYSHLPPQLLPGTIRLPPIQAPHTLFTTSPPFTPASTGSPYASLSPGLSTQSSANQPGPTPRSSTQATQSIPYRFPETTLHLSPSIASAHSSPTTSESRGTKRTYEETISDKERSMRPILPPLAAPPYEAGDVFSRVPPQPMAETGPVSGASTPSGTTSSFPHIGGGTSYSRRQSQSSMGSNTQRCTLHIRQHPRAARAGPDGRDRRSLDPPPVVQLLINDFDPDAPGDMGELRTPFFVVHCRLISSGDSPRRDVSTMAKVSEDGSKEVQRLLLGTAVSSPFFCQDDPDPEHCPSHPTTTNTTSGPPSPSSRFIPPSVAKTDSKKREVEPATLPATFFIFADLSVRKAGEYRLEFSLMKMDVAALAVGGTVPIVHSVTSQVFKVVNAKDFDQVQPSTNLVRGLLERGAGFPLKLKKGTREGQRRRLTKDGSEEGDEDDEDDDEDDG